MDLDRLLLVGRRDSSGVYSAGAGQRDPCATQLYLQVSYHWVADSLGSPCSSRASAPALLLERTLLSPGDFDG